MKDASIHIRGRWAPTGRCREILVSKYEFRHVRTYSLDISVNITFLFWMYKKPILSSCLLKTLLLTGGGKCHEGSVSRYIARLPDVFSSPMRCTSEIPRANASYSGPSLCYIGGPPPLYLKRLE